ncbi:PELOTA RNA binding domain-containing protein [Paenibacillus algorifonticola]|uniref:PELOTA RNA binding domain-containing protein n=1 Tax=Paenibacillus algorifonticola TaxID=684063 RepID=A0A1I2DXM4_9BACL|nr:cysteine protease StiP family protein [Paenibacillus algorifonticola]SFE85177.1 PELOTA RNA binding domain-containing protein [Paenibacillus algorifonticola]
MSRSLLEQRLQKPIGAPKPLGSYRPSDVVFLLKDLSDVQLERGTEDREEAIQSGVHYSEMLPVEYQPTPEYIRLFHQTLTESAQRVALGAGIVAEQVVARSGKHTVLVSLARAGTPIGILMKRYIAERCGLDVPHYSISIIRGKGIDENALLYILQQHGPEAKLQFVDGWTGKGAITKVLIEACQTFKQKYGIELNAELAVLADPACSSSIFGTREDFLIPSACLNSTVSGLMSRTVLRDDIIGPDDFHGAKFYKEWMKDDLSNHFIDTVSAYFSQISQQAKQEAVKLMDKKAAVTWQGLKDIKAIQKLYGIEDINLVKPGVGETTRVLLRRVPWKILVDRLDNPGLQHILLLAKDRGVPVEVFPELTYSCCGIIKPKNKKADIAASAEEEAV